MLSLFSADNLPYSVCFWTGLLLYLPGMIIINLFTNEVNFKTHRQNIIDGWKRETFIHTKIGLIVCFSVVITLMNLVAILVMIYITKSSFSIEVFYVLGYCFIQALVYLLFALLLATWFRKSGIAIIVFFVYGLFLETMSVWLVGKINASFSYYLPLQVSDSLIPFVQMGEFYKGLPAVWALLIGNLVYIVLYIYYSVRKYKYDDL